MALSHKSRRVKLHVPAACIKLLCGGCAAHNSMHSIVITDLPLVGGLGACKNVSMDFFISIAPQTLGRRVKDEVLGRRARRSVKGLAWPAATTFIIE
jgi:hypothetical protein